ncbi:MAG: Hsp20/alpha crystallin family protein [Bacteroidota bacterium]
MSLVKRNGGAMSSFPNLFDDFFNRDLFDWRLSNYAGTGASLPAVNIRENNDAFEVEMAAPGMTKKDFRIQLEGNTLSISSERNNETEQKEGENYTRKEFSYQSFNRTFTLPKDVVDSEKIKAQYVDGVLKLWIPKREEAKMRPPRMIEIG